MMKRLSGRVSIMKYLFCLCASACLLACSIVQKSQAPSTRGHYVVGIETSYGEMKLVLYNETPQHRDNFIRLIDEGYYDGIIFHRVIKDFMIQGGDAVLSGKDEAVMTGEKTIEAEFNYPKYFHKKGALAAARLSDAENPERRSSAYQFYIVDGKQNDEARLAKMKQAGNLDPFLEKWYGSEDGTPHLDGAYTVFGEVIEGLSLIDSIAQVPTLRGDKPQEDVTMSMKVLKRPRRLRQGDWDLNPQDRASLSLKEEK